VSPPRRDPLEDARRSLDAAAGALDGLRRLTVSAEPAGAALPAPAAESIKREALAASREDLRRTSAELETARAKCASLLEEIARLREELAARPTSREISDARAAGESAATRRAEELSRQVVGLKERVTLLSAEHVRLEALRRKAEASASDSELARRAMESALRRDLLAANAALDRAASESGVRDAKAVSEIEALRKRLESALALIQREEAARRQADEETPSLRADFQAAQAVIASLRKELSEHRAESLTRERALELRTHELERGLSAALSPPIPPAGAEPEEAEEAALEYPPMEYVLEPGWAKLFRLIKPPLQAAYGHLRRLSTGPMSAGQRAVLRLTGSSLSQAADALSTIELALSEEPATTEVAPVLPIVEAVLAAWEPVFRRRAIALSRDLSRHLPDAPHDPEHLRLSLHHVLRNAVEALPRGATVRVSLKKTAAEAVELEFRDDGPGYPQAWLARRFEAFVSPRPGHAGLGLAAVRRALLRWGGDAAASNGPAGKGACLTLTFGTATPRPATKP